MDAAADVAALRAMIESLQDAFVAFDRAWRFVYVNASAERFFDRSRDRLLGELLWEALPHVRGTVLEEHLRAAERAGTPGEFELTAPGTRRWMAARVHPSDDGWALTLRDVTERKAMESALRASEARYRSLVENSQDGVLLSIPAGAVLAANPAACDMLGRTEEEIKRVGRAGIIDPGDARLRELLEERARNGRAQGELRMLRNDGSAFPAQVATSIFVAHDGTERTCISFFDLTERKRLEVALQFLNDASAALGASLEYQETLRTGARAPVPERADLCIVDVLEKGELRCAAQARHGDGAVTVDVFAPHDARPTPAARARAMGVAGVVLTGADAAALFDDDAGGAIASAMVVPLGEPAAPVGVITLGVRSPSAGYDAMDVAIARRFAQLVTFALDNAKAYRAAAEARRLRDEMLGIVAHDLRNPLNGILLHATLIGRKYRADPPEEVNAIRRAVASASRLVEDLLVVARTEAGALKLERRTEDMRAVIDDVLAMQGAAAHDAGIELATEIAPDVSELPVDRHRIAQALTNLVSNALKFTPHGGRITVGARVSGDGMDLYVRDTGAGIPEAERAHLFDRFWQGTQSRRADAGLGLAIVKGIAEAHGGRVEVESTVGRGSTFTLKLPA